MSQETMECKLAQALMPLVQANKVGKDSIAFLEEHCQTCKECKELFETEKIDLPKNSGLMNGKDVETSRKSKKGIKKLIKFAGIYVAGIIIGGIALLYAWSYIMFYLY